MARIGQIGVEGGQCLTSGFTSRGRDEPGCVGGCAYILSGGDQRTIGLPERVVVSDRVTEPSRLSYDAIRDYAERVGERYDIYGRGGAGDVRELVRQLGGRVAVGDSSESLHVNAVGDFIIYLPHMTSSRRDQFTIAHELGHYFLHYLHPKRDTAASFGRGERNVVETQANVFASSLLMPTEPFKKAWARHSGNARALAKIFDVSPAAVEVRAEVLGLTGSPGTSGRT